LNPAYLDQILIAYQFDEVIQSVIHNIKYHQKPNLGFKLGSVTATILSKYFNNIEDKYYLPIPLHPIREKERGYNQSEFISRGIMKIQDGKIVKNILIRNKNTTTQTNLNREERQENVHQAFSFKNEIDISGKSLILVDDLITTGATMNECSRVLMENGAGSVIGFAIASPADINH
jgi:ComF family protein